MDHAVTGGLLYTIWPISVVLPLFEVLGIRIPVLSCRTAQHYSVVERLRQEYGTKAKAIRKQQLLTDDLFLLSQHFAPKCLLFCDITLRNDI